MSDLIDLLVEWVFVFLVVAVAILLVAVCVGFAVDLCGGLT